MNRRGEPKLPNVGVDYYKILYVDGSPTSDIEL